MGCSKEHSLNLWISGDLARTDRPQLSFYTTHCVSKVCLLFGQKEITRLHLVDRTFSVLKPLARAYKLVLTL